MVDAKRARKAETPKQPSLCLRLRAPQFYPDRPSGMRGGLTETWAMVEAKRARTAETPKPPSFDLRSRAPYFYPTFAYTWEGSQKWPSKFLSV